MLHAYPRYLYVSSQLHQLKNFVAEILTEHQHSVLHVVRYNRPINCTMTHLLQEMADFLAFCMDVCIMRKRTHFDLSDTSFFESSKYRRTCLEGPVIGA